MVRTMALKPTNNESGLLNAQLTVGEVTSAHVDPVPAKAPGVIVFEPETANEEHVYYKTRDAVNGTISGLVRDYTNLNGGVGIQHEANAPWETFQSAEYVENLVDIVQEGFFEEFNTVLYVNATTFTVATNRTYYYAANRVVRFNVDNSKLGIVASSSYNGGTGLTTVVINFGTVPATLTNVELGIQPNGATAQMVTGSAVQTGALIYAADAGSTDAYAVTLSPVPTAYIGGLVVNFKANTINTGPATLNVNGLGAVTIKKNYNVDLADGDIKANQLVSVIYDAVNSTFQMLSPVTPAVAAAFWTLFAGAYASATTMTVPTDLTGIFHKGVVLKWQKSDGTFKTAIVQSSSYGAPNTTITVLGSAVEAGDKLFYYGGDALVERFLLPMTIGTGTDLAQTWYMPKAGYILNADAYVKTAGTTNPTTFDINIAGTTKFTTKPSIASGATSDINNVADTPATAVAVESAITVDVDAVSTTAPIEAYIYLYWFPTWWVNRT